MSQSTAIIAEYTDIPLNLASDHYDLEKRFPFEIIKKKNLQGTWYLPDEYPTIVSIVRDFWNKNKSNTDMFAGIYRKKIEDLFATIDFIHTIDVLQFVEDRWIITDLVWRMYLMLYSLAIYSNKYIYDNVFRWINDAEILVNTAHWFLEQHDITYVSHDDENSKTEILDIDYFDDNEDIGMFDLRKQNNHKDIYAQNCDYSFNMITYQDTIDWEPSEAVSNMREKVDRLIQDRFYDHYFELIDDIEALYTRIRERVFFDEYIAISGQPWIYEDYLWRANLMIYSLFVYDGPLTKELNDAFHTDAVRLIDAFERYADYIAKANETSLANN